jgi:hypothetical protein
MSLVEYIAMFLPMLPDTFKRGDNSNNITGLIFYLDNKNEDRREPILEMIYSDNKEHPLNLVNLMMNLKLKIQK